MAVRAGEDPEHLLAVPGERKALLGDREPEVWPCSLDLLAK